MIRKNGSFFILYGYKINLIIIAGMKIIYCWNKLFKDVEVRPKQETYKIMKKLIIIINYAIL